MLPFCYHFVTIFGIILQFCYHFWYHVTILLPFLVWKCLMTLLGNHYSHNLHIELSLHTNFQLDWINVNFLMMSPTTPSPHPTDKLGLRPPSTLTSACVHVVYMCLCSCCVHVPVFMLRTRACTCALMENLSGIDWDVSA